MKPNELINRRSLLRGAGVGAAGLGAAALIGCSDSEEESSSANSASSTGSSSSSSSAATAAASGPKLGGVMQAGQTAEINPTTGYPFVFLAENPYLTLPVEPAIKYRDNLEPEMILAERYEFNSDLTGATIQLKPGLEFHNGAPVTASDYVFGLELLNDPEAFGVTGSFQLKKFSDSITDFKIVDDLTIDFTFDKPRPNMTDFFAQLMVTHRDSYADVIGGKGIVGTGPFTWDEYIPGEKVSFKKNESYHYSDVLGGPHMDGVEVSFFADMDAMGLAFEAGELDMFYGDPSVAARFRDDGLTRLTPKRGVVYVGMNVTSDQLGDPRVRRALFYAVDRTRAVTELGEGFGEVTAQSWPKGSPAWREALEAPLYYPEDAKKLLAEAGFTQTRPIVIDHRSTQSYIDHATLLKENFEAIGVEVELNAMEPTAFIKRLRAREFPDLWITAHAFANLSPVTNFLMTFPFREGNMSFYEPEEYISIIRALETVKGTSDAAQAQYDLFEKLWIENPWLIPMRPTQSIIVKSEKLQGFDKVSIAPQEPPYAELWLDS